MDFDTSGAVGKLGTTNEVLFPHHRVDMQRKIVYYYHTARVRT